MNNLSLIVALLGPMIGGVSYDPRTELVDIADHSAWVASNGIRSVDEIHCPPGSTSTDSCARRLFQVFDARGNLIDAVIFGFRGPDDTMSIMHNRHHFDHRGLPVRTVTTQILPNGPLVRHDFISNERTVVTTIVNRRFDRQGRMIESVKYPSGDTNERAEGETRYFGLDGNVAFREQFYLEAGGDRRVWRTVRYGYDDGGRIVAVYTDPGFSTTGRAALFRYSYNASGDSMEVSFFDIVPAAPGQDVAQINPPTSAQYRFWRVVNDAHGNAVSRSASEGRGSPAYPAEFRSYLYDRRGLVVERSDHMIGRSEDVRVLYRYEFE